MLADVDEVTNIADSNRDAATPARNPAKRKKTMLSILALLGISGGFLTPFLGLLCIIAHATLPNDTAFNRLGTVLMIIAIPPAFGRFAFSGQTGRGEKASLSFSVIRKHTKEIMFDLIFIAVMLVFFVLAAVYLRACQALRKGAKP